MQAEHAAILNDLDAFMSSELVEVNLWTRKTFALSAWAYRPIFGEPSGAEDTSGERPVQG